ncbi:hypothetical protein [Indiicoccus explosivorum]|uniref:hypothetical protein n=1 Tax=Indiicoccus explosivorum TaxID=1917864 RepID=UPI0012D751F8|nr:hypothetical protein [Indiicoccus explosivorum]
MKKQLLGTAIQQELFFCTFLSSVENRLNSLVIWNVFEEWNRKNDVLTGTL